MKKPKEYQLRTNPDVYYIWVAGSCDYGHEKRCSGGAYLMMLNDNVIETYVVSKDHTTEFRMILTVMRHAMEIVPKESKIVFLTNVSYIQRNWDKPPTDTSANADLIQECIKVKDRHNSVSTKLVPFHKYHQLQETNNMAHKAMIKLRTQ